MNERVTKRLVVERLAKLPRLPITRSRTPSRTLAELRGHTPAGERWLWLLEPEGSVIQHLRPLTRMRRGNVAWL